MKIRSREGPEHKIQRNLINLLQCKGWMTCVTNGNIYQQGFPDLYVLHKVYGTRWIDVKNPGRYTFTIAQRETWPAWGSLGVGVWILTGADEQNYDRLFQPPNFRDYWKASWDDDTAKLNSLIDDLRNADD